VRRKNYLAFFKRQNFPSRGNYVINDLTFLVASAIAAMSKRQHRTMKRFYKEDRFAKYCSRNKNNFLRFIKHERYPHYDMRPWDKVSCWISLIQHKRMNLYCTCQHILDKSFLVALCMLVCSVGFLDQYVHRMKCPCSEISPGKNISGAKVKMGEMPMSMMTTMRNIWGPRVHGS
jgi:hypothetical protein